MAGEPPTDDLLARLVAGDDAAAAEVFHRFAGRLIALARSRLDPQLRAKVDPEDVVQSVYRSFFRRQADGEFDFRDPDNLWTMLALITVRKCANRAQHFHAARRDVRQETALVPGSDDSSPGPHWMAREPTPVEAAQLTETVEQLMRGLEGYEREVVVLALEGASAEEISTHVGRARRTVQRVLQHVKKVLQRWRHADAESSNDDT